MVHIGCSFVHSFVTRNFQRLGGCIARNPKTCIAIPLILTALLSLGVLRLRIIDDFEYLYAPRDGRSWSELAVVNSYFDMNFSTSFDPRKITRFKPYGQVVILAKDGRSVLREDLFRDIINLDKKILTFEINVDGEQYSYQTICARSKLNLHNNYPKCLDNQILNLESRIKDIENRTVMLNYPLSIDERTMRPNFYGGILGGVEIDSYGFINSAKALRLSYFLDPHYGVIAEKWENAFLVEVDTFKSEKISISMIMSRTMGEEMGKTTISLMPILPATASMMLLFSVISCLMRDWVMGKPWLGTVSCIGAILAVVSGAGLCLALGLEFVIISIGSAFLILGIALDDAFIIIAAWRLTNSSMSVETRMKKAFGHAGVSITVTSITNLICLIICTSTPIEGLRNFSIFMIAMLVFSYAYQLLFFGGFMVIFGNYERDNKHSLTCRPVIPLSMAEDRSIAFRLFCTGGKNHEDSDNPLDNREHMVMVFFRDYIGGLVTYTPAKIVLMVIFFGYLGVSIYGALQLSEGLETEELLVTNTHTYNFSEANRQYFTDYSLSIQVLITTPLDYSNSSVQSQIEDLVETFKQNPYVSEITDFWLTQYLFVKNSMGFLLWKYDLSSKEGFLECLHNVFFGIPYTREYRNDIVFDENGTDIIATRFYILTVGLETSQDVKQMLLSVREIADNSIFNVTVYSPMFITYDQLIHIRSTAIKAISISVAAIMIVTIIFFPSLKSGIMVGLYMFTTEIGVVGLMVLWGVKLNTLSMMGLVISIGLAVDNTAHMTHAYLSSTVKGDSKARVKDALYFVGMAIVQASTSTYIMCIGMILIPSKLFMSLFKLITLVLWLSCLNCLFILPIFLSFIDDLRQNLSSKPATETFLFRKKVDPKIIEKNYI